ncbi:hypothetical protein P154DRAFT_360010 [Amniculicola lignicola CBS 123094]|uniref:Uncharacterized protein n=1 Tax=Amniculicola lignicola CBS 123094 TaxID=1392246 RepID=A0A6A5W4I5_9PLEO|nr:hypothetical protein P154DRAFT_360010 [Amniculicola lignicola CBS 123094]
MFVLALEGIGSCLACFLSWLLDDYIRGPATAIQLLAADQPFATFSDLVLEVLGTVRNFEGSGLWGDDVGNGDGDVI